MVYQTASTRERIPPEQIPPDQRPEKESEDNHHLTFSTDHEEHYPGHAESLAAYMHTVSQKPLLTAAEEKRLARRVQSGCPRARNKLIEHNMRLVIHNVKRFRGFGLDFEELLQEGTFGLIRAVEKFDPEMGYKFSTYATWWINQKAGRAIMDKGRSIRIPVHYQEQLRKLSRAENGLGADLGRQPTVGELATELELTEDKVAELLDRRRPIGSLDEPVSGSGPFSGSEQDVSDLISFIGDENQAEEAEEHLHYIERREKLWQCLFSLPERERYVLQRRYGLAGDGACTLEELAAELGTKREVIRQIQLRAQTRIKTILGGVEAA